METWSDSGTGAARAAQRLPATAGGAVKRVRPQLSTLEVLLQVWRSKTLMLLIFTPFLLAGIAAALLTETKYTASTRLLVRLGPEYVFNPIVGDAARGTAPQVEDMVQSEVQLAQSPVIAERVIDTMGLGRLYPKLARVRESADEASTHRIDRKAREAFAKDLTVGAGPNSSIIRMTYAHPDSQVATETLNAFVQAYTTYRREVLDGGAGEALGTQREAIEGKLATADKALQVFLKANGLTDYEVERDAVVKLYADLANSISATESDLSEARGRVSALNRVLTATPKRIDLYVESTSEQTLVNLKLQRQDLLARYTPESRAVQDIDKKIAQVQDYLKSADGQGLRRVGPNPTYQSIESDLAEAQANADALAAKVTDMRSQQAAAGAQRAKLLSLEAQWGELARERTALKAAADAYATREQTERAQSEMSARKADNISVYEPATTPVNGASPKRLIVAGAALLGLLTALVAALARAWTTTTFPTAASLERTLRIPVLAAVGER